MTVADVVPDGSGLGSVASPSISPSEQQRLLFLVADSPNDEKVFDELRDQMFEGGTQLRGLPGIASSSVASIEQLATKHIEAMRRVQPLGPYRLAGMGSGGLVAYEMAFQLIGDDQIVEFLGMVDSRRPLNDPASMAGGVDVCNRYCPQPLPITVHLFVSPDTANTVSREWMELAGCKLSTNVMRAESGLLRVKNAGQYIAQLLREGSSDKGRAEAASEPKYSPLITIQAGKRTERPFFCVPGAGANITSLLSLAEALGPGLPVHGLQPRGMDKMFVPHSSVPAAAKAYLREVRALEPRGPYRLLGHSFGGWVVFEMARQLIETGQAVDCLVLIDTQPPSERAQVRFHDRIDVLTKLIQILEQSSEKSLGLARVELEQLGYDVQLLRLMERMKSAGLLPQSARVEVIRSLVRVFATNVNTAYTPDDGVVGEMLLVQAQEAAACGEPEDTDDVDDDAAAEGWRRYAARVVQVKTPGNHMTMLKKPNVEAAGAHIRAFLDRRFVT